MAGVDLGQQLLTIISKSLGCCPPITLFKCEMSLLSVNTTLNGTPKC